jgi:NADPH:quinone reductase-like Zn-dependent oxidoreductase
MRVAGITARGEPVEILEVDELAPPAADEVLLDVAAAGIGNWDELVRIGSWPALTAAQALDEALGIESGGWVVVNAAGGVTGGLLVQLAAARGARVIATASAKKAERVRGYGASEVLDYHGDWPALVREITGGGAPKAVNAARGQAATTLKAVADGGRLATITGDAPREERGVAVSDVYVRPDGRQLSALAELLACGTLSVPIASVRPLEQAAQALREVVAGADGAIVLSLRT